MHSITSENDRDYEMITSIQQKLIFDKITPSKCTGEILNGLMQELNQLKAELTGKKNLFSIDTIYFDIKTKTMSINSRINNDYTRNESDGFSRWEKENFIESTTTTKT
jgi:hypothetical protein